MGVSLYPADTALPPGMVMPYAGTIAPNGWLICNGQSLLRADYPDLFAAIGTTYGLGTDVTTNTTFALPNLKGKVIVGVDLAQIEFDTLGESGGSKTSTAQHTHDLSNHGHNRTAAGPSNNTTSGINWKETAGHWPNTNTTGTVSSWHRHPMNHWHLANIGNVAFNFAGTHAHHDRAQTVAEGPWEDYRFPGASVPVNVDGTAQAAPGGNNWTGDPNNNHSHDLQNHWHTIPNHDHLMQSHTHGDTIGTPTNNTSGASSAGAASGNLQPYMALHYLIKT